MYSRSGQQVARVLSTRTRKLCTCENYYVFYLLFFFFVRYTIKTKCYTELICVVYDTFVGYTSHVYELQSLNGIVKTTQNIQTYRCHAIVAYFIRVAREHIQCLRGRIIGIRFAVTPGKYTIRRARIAVPKIDVLTTINNCSLRRRAVLTSIDGGAEIPVAADAATPVAIDRATTTIAVVATTTTTRDGDDEDGPNAPRRRRPGTGTK